MPETRGRSLEDIDAEFKGKSVRSSLEALAGEDGLVGEQGLRGEVGGTGVDGLGGAVGGFAGGGGILLEEMGRTPMRRGKESGSTSMGEVV